MLRRRAALLAVSLLPLEALASAHAQAPSPAQSAEGFLQSIYDPYLKDDFKGQPFWQVDRFFAPPLARAIETDMRDAKRRGEVPALDGDPFLDAQDWDIENLAITVKAEGPKAVGEIAFDNQGKRVGIVVDLVQTRAGWRITDIKAPSGSLSDLYKAK